MKSINLINCSTLYSITEDGVLYSHRKHKYCKSFPNSCGYLVYSLTDSTGKQFFKLVHTLVALTYNGDPPTDKHEVNHKDGNKFNNHYSNLEWMTHRDNILHSYNTGLRLRENAGRKPGFKMNDDTKAKMSARKLKPVKSIEIATGRETMYNSVADLCEALSICRRQFNKILNGQARSIYTFKLI